MENDEIQEGPVTTTIMQSVSMVFDGWIVLEVQQLWSDLRYRFGTDDRRANMSFSRPSIGVVLVALPTRDDPPESPKEIDGLNIISLDEYYHAVMAVVEANEKIRKTLYDKLSSNF
jgi:hypothetical protein